MKKIMTIAAIAMCVFAANAVQVNWNAKDIMKDGSALAKGSFTGYLFDASDYSTSDVEDAIKGGTLASLSYIGNVGSAAAAGMISGAKKDLPAGYSAGDTLTVFAVILDSATPAEAKQYIFTQSMTAEIKGSGSTSFAFGSQASAKWGDVVDVPEPTSLALIALGVAAFGLKRKHA